MTLRDIDGMGVYLIDHCECVRHEQNPMRLKFWPAVTYFRNKLQDLIICVQNEV